MRCLEVRICLGVCAGNRKVFRLFQGLVISADVRSLITRSCPAIRDTSSISCSNGMKRRLSGTACQATCATRSASISRPDREPHLLEMLGGGSALRRDARFGHDIMLQRLAPEIEKRPAAISLKMPLPVEQQQPLLVQAIGGDLGLPAVRSFGASLDHH